MRYEAPNSLDQAVALLAKETGDARVLAGGTDLLVQMRTDVLDPVLVVDIKGIAETAPDQGGGAEAFASAPPSPAPSSRSTPSSSRSGPASSRPPT